MLLELLESRDNCSNLIPDWTGGEQVVSGRFDGDLIADDAVVAEMGGSCRLMIFSGADGSVLLNTIVFDPAFRGGGRAHTINGEHDTLLIVPGPGGGPVVAQFDFDGIGAITMSQSFYAPFPISFRGGLSVSSGDVNGDGVVEALFLPGAGGGPQLVAVNMRTFETELSIWVGDPEDLSGEVRFEPTGGMLLVRTGPAFIIQYGETVDGYAPSKIWSLAGIEIGFGD